MQRDEAQIRADLNGEFPHLTTIKYEIASPNTSGYNCIAWAAEDDQHWWWPIPGGLDAVWPKGCPRSEARDSFVAAFQLLGYAVCSDSKLQRGYKKVAIYELPDRVRHMARQLHDGSWASKLGQEVDIVHESLEAIEGHNYGKATTFMSKKIARGCLPRPVAVVLERVRQT
jgi:hypothetical protein